MEKNYIYSIIFCSILIFSIYTIPDQIGDAHAHLSSSHSDCWTDNWELLDNIITFTILGIQIALLIAAPWTFGASLAYVPVADIVGFVAKMLSIPGQFLLVSACAPQIIRPPTQLAGKSHLECTGDEGFSFTKIESTDKASLTTDSFGDSRTGHEIFGTDIVLPDTVDVEKFTMGTVAWVLWIIFLLLDIILFYVTVSQLKKPAEETLKATFKASTTTAKLINPGTVTKAGELKILFGLLDTADKVDTGLDVFQAVEETTEAAGGDIIPDNFEIPPSKIAKYNSSAVAGHPLVALTQTVGLGTDANQGAGTFNLGKNDLFYKAEKKVNIGTLAESTDFPINVYDNEAPTINFGDRQSIELEANTHFGYKVDQRSLPELQNGIVVDDVCDKSVEPEYIGPSFFLLSSLKSNQYAPWKVEDTAPNNGYWGLVGQDAQRSLEQSGIVATKPTIIAQISPTEKVQFTPFAEGSTLRHIQMQAANAEINKLIQRQIEFNELPAEADVVISGDLIDFVTDDEIKIVGVVKDDIVISEVREFSSTVNLSQEQIDALINGEYSTQTSKSFAKAFVNTPSQRVALHAVSAEPNVFVDFQTVTVVDTTSPSIFVTEDLALEVNPTNPEQTTSVFHPDLVDNTRGGCIKENEEFTCALRIEPPAIFDIADPFPDILQNFTTPGIFTKIEEDLFANFTLGVSTIGWKAIDFSGRGENNIVTQIVNLKLEGNNTVSNVFDLNYTVSSTVPQQITLIANNTDKDPLKFFIESSPSKGILDTPIDAVFATKFTQVGSVSKLKGMTNEGGDDIFFPDSRNDRILKMDTLTGDVSESFRGSFLGEPEAISKSGNIFTISDWPHDKIIQTTSDGNITQTYKVQGLFEEPENLTVDPDGKIYVTDSKNATISILDDFDIFNSPMGIEVDNNTKRVYVVENQINEVKIFDLLGVFIKSFGNDDLDLPTDIATDSQGNIYVLETGNNAIKNFTSDHSFVISFSSDTNLLTFFDQPEGITTNGTDIIIADTKNHQVKKISEFTPQIQEFYDNATEWTQTATDISIKVGQEIVEFNKVESGPGNPLEYIFQDLIETLKNSWSAEFKIRSGNLNDNANAFIWLLTNDTSHPQNVTSQNAIGIIYDQQELKIFQRHGAINTTSAGILLPSNNQNYFVSLDKIENTLAAMVVFDDEDRTTQIANGNVTLALSNNLSNLHVLQHANDIANGNETLTLDIDNTFINPLLTWLGKCDTGPNCNAGISNQFTCTDTTCFGSGAGSLDGQFDLPKGISANSTHLFVADYNNNRMQIFNSGNHVSSLNVTLPTDVEYSSSSDSTAVSSENQTVVIFTNNGGTISFGESGDFSSISGLGADSSGKFYVSDNTLNSVQIFDEVGVFVEEWQSSITSRVGDFIQRIQLYFPGMQVGAIDSHDGTVMIGDWTNNTERVVVANQEGGNLTQHDISQVTSNPHSLVFSGDEIFVSDPESKKLVVLDKDNGSNLRNITALNNLNQIITPTGITINDITEFPGKKIYVFDNRTEKIFSIVYPNNDCIDPVDFDGDGVSTLTDPDDENACNPDPQNVNCSQPDGDKDNDGVDSEVDPDNDNACIPDENDPFCVLPEPVDDDNDGVTVFYDPNDDDKCIPHLPSELVFNAKDLFANLNDIAVNNTHVLGLDLNQNQSSIVQVRWDKGIEDNITVENVTGLAMGHADESNLLFYTTTGVDNELSFFNRTDRTTTTLFNLTSLNITPSGIAVVPNISGLVSTPIVDLIDPRGLAFDPDNEKLYLSDFGASEIKVYEASTNNLIDTISEDILLFPTDLVFGPDGNLFVASFGNNKILKINVTDNNITLFAGAGNSISGPTGLAISSNDEDLFVSSTLEDRITRHSLVNVTDTISRDYTTEDGQQETVSQIINLKTEGEFLGEFVNSTNRGSLSDPLGITIFGDKLYVASSNSDEILVWDMNGVALGLFGQANGTSGLDGPSGITFSKDGESLFVSSINNDQILQFDGNDGMFKGVFADETLMSPDGLTISPKETLFVSNIGSGEILEYGKLQAKYFVSDWSGTDKIFALNDTGIVFSKTIPNLTDPHNIATDSKGTLWIADKNGKQVVMLNPASNAPPTAIDTSNIIEVFIPPLRMVEDDLWVDDAGNTYTSNVTSITSTIKPHAISLDKKDNLFIADWDNHRIVQVDEDKIICDTCIIKVNSTFTEPIGLAINHTIPMNPNQNDPGTLHNIWAYDSNFDESNIGKLISLDPEKQFRQIIFEDELAPLLRGLTINGTKMITTPSNSGSQFIIQTNLTANFDTRHFIIPLGIDLGDGAIYVSDWKEKRIIDLDQSGDFDKDYDFKLVGFATCNTVSCSTGLADFEVDEDREFFWIAEPERAAINKVTFEGNLTKVLGVSDKFVFISAVTSDKDDTFYVASNQENVVKKFDLRSRLLATSNVSPIDSVSVAAQDTFPTDLTFSLDGTKMFVVGNDGNDINEYTCTAPYDVSTCSFVDSFSVAAQDTSPIGLEFSLDGKQMFVAGNDGNDITQYTCTLPYDVSTCTFSGLSLAVIEPTPNGLAFSSNGLTMSVVGDGRATVFQYSCPIPFNFLFCSLSSLKFVAAQDTFPTGLTLSFDGLHMFVLGDANDSVYHYICPIPSVIGHCQFTDSLDISAQETSPTGLEFSIDGKKMFVTGNDSDSVHEYVCNTPFSLSTCSLDEISMMDIALSTDESEVFLATSEKIIKYNSTNLEKIGSSLVLPITNNLLYNPSSVAVDKNGDIYVSKIGSNEILIFDNMTNPKPSLNLQDHDNVADMVIDSDGNLYAADIDKHRVYKYNLDTKLFLGWLGKCDANSNVNSCLIENLHSKGFTCDDSSCPTSNSTSPQNGLPYGRDNGQFYQPNRLAIDGLDNIYVSDTSLSIALTTGDVGTTNIFTEAFNNLPRVQKFTQAGFFVNKVISSGDDDQIDGDFNLIKSISHGANNFYVADVDILHVFDVSPFSNIKFNATTQNTTAQVVYESILDIVNESDSFSYKSFDGFDFSNNIATINLNITNPDSDGDGLYGNIDNDSTFSDEFKSLSPDGTSGSIVDRNDQTLIVREARDQSKGVFIQSSILNNDFSTLELCDGLAQIKLTPADRLFATCTITNNTVATGVELEILRGEVQGNFTDGEGRISSYLIPPENTIFFGNEFVFIASDKNFNSINQHVTFNGESLTYKVDPGETVQVDTLPPVFDDQNCSIPLKLDAESVLGVIWSGDKDNPTGNNLTGQGNEIMTFLNINATDQDNGIQHNTEGLPISVTSNVTDIINVRFPYSNSSTPIEIPVEFFTVDKIGNNATCTNSVLVKDDTPPILEFGSEFSEDSNGLLISNTTSDFSEDGRVFWNLPKVLDLPAVFGDDPIEVPNSMSSCNYVSGSSFKLSPVIRNETGIVMSLDTFVGCGGNDLSDNLTVEMFGFNVRITPNENGLRIKNVTAFDSSNPPASGLNAGDSIWVQFTMPTNQPPVSNQTELDAIFALIDGNFGNDSQGSWINPSNLLITINDVGFPTEFTVDTTFFDLKNNPALTSSGGLLNSSGTLGVPVDEVLLVGDFSTPISPLIQSFVASDPDLTTNGTDGRGYSEDDLLTIRFSEPTNCNNFSCKVFNKNQINKLFSFSDSIGDKYSGDWKNPSTLVITIDKVNEDPSLNPVLGTTTVTVIGDIMNSDETSPSSTFTSPPLSGSFGQFYKLMDVNENSIITQTLASGITLGISFPNGTTVGLIEGNFTSDGNIIMSEIIDVTPTNSTIDCEMGCDVTYWIHSSELYQYNVGPNNLRIFHDANEDGIIQSFEMLIPEVDQITTNLFSVTVKLFSFSSISLAAIPSGGGGGDSTAPEYQNIAISGGGGFKDLVIGDVKFDSNEGTASIQTGEGFTITVDLYENSGIQNLQHISLYMNLLGFDTMVHQSDTYIRWDKGLPVTVNDPHGYFLDADVELFEVGNKVQAVFTFTFAKPMEPSDVIIRAWDIFRNSADVNFRDLIKVTGDVVLFLPELPAEGMPGAGNYTSVLTDEFMDKWAGFSSETISDDELLMHIGLEGNYIPEWFKETTAKWFMEEKISEKEFIDALEFLSRNLFLYPS